MLPLMSDAEHTLVVGIHRAIDLINAHDPSGARRALEVALSAAELLDERETLDDGDDGDDGRNLEDLRTSQ